MSDIVEGLKRKRKTIEQFQRDKARQEGEEAQLFKQLKNECDADTVEKAEKVIECLCEEKAESEELLKALDGEMDQIIHNALPGSGSGTT